MSSHWATCSNPPNLRVFLSLTNTHIPKIAGANYITLRLKKTYFKL